MSALDTFIQHKDSCVANKLYGQGLVCSCGCNEATVELAALRERAVALEAEKDFYKNNAGAWKKFAEHQEFCAVCAEDVDNCETGSLLRSVANVKIDDILFQGEK